MNEFGNKFGEDAILTSGWSGREIRTAQPSVSRTSTEE